MCTVCLRVYVCGGWRKTWDVAPCLLLRERVSCLRCVSRLAHELPGSLLFPALALALLGLLDAHSGTGFVRVLGTQVQVFTLA